MQGRQLTGAWTHQESAKKEPFLCIKVLLYEMHVLVLMKPCLFYSTELFLCVVKMIETEGVYLHACTVGRITIGMISK